MLLHVVEVVYFLYTNAESIYLISLNPNETSYLSIERWNVPSIIRRKQHTNSLLLPLLQNWTYSFHFSHSKKKKFLL